jgi:TolB-like protein
MYERKEIHMNFARRAPVLRAALAGVLLLAITAGAYAQSGEKLGKIAILPFSGGSADEQDGIAELFSGTKAIMDNFGVIPRTGIVAAAQREQAFQNMSGMTDADTIAKLGEQFGAEYVMAGSITSLGRRNLLIVTIVRIDVIQQVAGAFLEYGTLDELNNNLSLLDNMAAELIKMVQTTGDGADKLALLPVQFAGGANAQEGDALAQLLAIHILRIGKYAVYPRTKTLDEVQKEYTTQLTSGNTAINQQVQLGAGVNPPYVLSVVSRKIGTGTRFNASIIELEKNEQIQMKSEQYANLSDGKDAVEFLARELSGQTVSAKDRARRTNAVDKEITSTERAEKTAANLDKFLKSSGVVIGGWLGYDLAAPTGSEGSGSSTETSDTAFFGGGNIELRLYRYVGIQAGAAYVVNGLQIPLLARVTVPLWDLFEIAGFGGIGINVGGEEPVSAVGGAEVGFKMWNIGISVGYQWNGYHTLQVGASYFIPFRRK